MYEVVGSYQKLQRVFTLEAVDAGAMDVFQILKNQFVKLADSSDFSNYRIESISHNIVKYGDKYYGTMFIAAKFWSD